MTLAQALTVLRARRRAALLTFLCVFGLVLLGTLAQPKAYTATATVVLDVKSPDPIVGVVLPGMTVSSYMATQVDVLQSERVVLAALRTLQADKDPQLRDQWQGRTQGRGDFGAWLAEDAMTRLKVMPDRESNVIAVAFTSRDPELSARTANAVVRAYIATTLELRTEPAKQFNELFNDSTKALRESLEAAQARLSAFQQEKGIVTNDEKFDIESARLNELSAQLLTMEGTATESKNRSQQAHVDGSKMQEVLGNQMIQTLSADLARQQARLSELRARLGERNPQVLEQAASVEELRARMNVEKERISGSIAVNNEVNVSRLQSLRGELAAQRARVLQMKGLRDEAAVLQRDVENAQRVYDAGFLRLSQSTLESQATQTNVSVLKWASPPPFPSSPRLVLNAVVGGVLALVLALVVTALREGRDERLRSEDDVRQALNVPLLGVLPVRGPMSGGGGAAMRRLLPRLLPKTSSTQPSH